MTEVEPGKKKLLIGALVFGVVAIGAMAFVMIEPIAAYDNLRAGVYEFEPRMQEAMELGRMNEAAMPTLIGLIAGVAGLAFGVVGREGPRKLALAGWALNGVAVLLGLYVMIQYPLSF